MFTTGKRESTLLTGRRRCVGEKLSTILDYILDHAGQDKRPYFQVDILGTTLLGLLDSEASATIVDEKGWKSIRDLGLQLNTSEIVSCRVANE